jgi:hypothetical protein
MMLSVKKISRKDAKAQSKQEKRPIPILWLALRLSVFA